MPTESPNASESEHAKDDDDDDYESNEDDEESDNGSESDDSGGEKGILESKEIKGLQDYSSPSTVSLIGCRSSTGARAEVFTTWIKGRFAEALPDVAPTTLLAF